VTARAEIKGGKTFFKVNLTELASTAVTDSTTSMGERSGTFISLLSTRSQLSLTASALKGAPSWKVTPWRSLKV
jgi:hypothetical protein